MRPPLSNASMGGAVSPAECVLGSFPPCPVPQFAGESTTAFLPASIRANPSAGLLTRWPRPISRVKLAASRDLQFLRP